LIKLFLWFYGEWAFDKIFCVQFEYKINFYIKFMLNEWKVLKLRNFRLVVDFQCSSRKNKIQNRCIFYGQKVHSKSFSEDLWGFQRKDITYFLLKFKSRKLKGYGLFRYRKGRKFDQRLKKASHLKQLQCFVKKK
jgi:hypothetical protein